MFDKHPLYAVLCLLVVAAATVIAWKPKLLEGSGHMPTPMPVAILATSRTTAVVPKQTIWNIYKNSEYGFILQYPPTLVIESKPDPAVPTALDTTTGSTVAEQVLVTIPIIRMGTSAATATASALVRVGVLKNVHEAVTCAAASTETRMINGMPFAVIPIATTSASQAINGKSYRTFHNNTCFVIDQLHSGMIPKALPNLLPQPIPPTATAAANAIIKTIQFTQ